MDEFNQFTNITIPAKPEYVGVARLVVAAFAGLLGFDDETVEDIKIAVSEACTNAIIQLHRQPHPRDTTVNIIPHTRDGDLIIDVEYSLKEAGSIEKAYAQSQEKDLGISVLTSIVDNVEVVKTQNHSIILRLTKKAKR